MALAKSLAIPALLVPLAFLALDSSRAAEPVILGDYVEARNCDVWTGPCFANGEMNLKGDHAILGWVVRQGSWNGQDLSGLGIVAAIDSEGTLTLPTEGMVQTVLYVDEKASESQAAALIALASELAPRYVKNVVKVHRGPVALRREGERSVLEAGEKVEVKVETAPLQGHCDSICGNEARFYPALAKLTEAESAKAVQNLYRGADLDVRWSDPNARSATVGTFSL